MKPTLAFSRTVRSAFTLVELSIVLVILGLLIGGVLTGQSLIRAAELRSITTQEQRYITATQTFRDKYFALPGDMTNATAYWGTATTCPGDYTSPSTTATTCNGNGDGLVYLSTGSTEQYRFWQHLANAGLIEGNYTGEPGASYFWNTTTANAPAGRLSGSIWSIAGRSNTTGGFSASIAYVDLGNALFFGGPSTTWNNGYVVTPPEAYNIDTKLDDGIPNTGRVMAATLTPCSGVTNGGVTPAAYVLSSTTVTCFLYFPNAF